MAHLATKSCQVLKEPQVGNLLGETGPEEGPCVWVARNLKTSNFLGLCQATVRVWACQNIDIGILWGLGALGHQNSPDLKGAS